MVLIEVPAKVCASRVRLFSHEIDLSRNSGLCDLCVLLRPQAKEQEKKSSELYPITLWPHILIYWITEFEEKSRGRYFQQNQFWVLFKYICCYDATMKKELCSVIHWCIKTEVLKRLLSYCHMKWTLHTGCNT